MSQRPSTCGELRWRLPRKVSCLPSNAAGHARHWVWSHGAAVWAAHSAYKLRHHGCTADRAKDDPDEAWPPRFVKLQLTFSDGTRAAFCDARRFARFRLLPAGQDPLAAEPLARWGLWGCHDSLCTSRSCHCPLAAHLQTAAHQPATASTLPTATHLHTLNRSLGFDPLTDMPSVEDFTALLGKRSKTAKLKALLLDQVRTWLPHMLPLCAGW